MGCANSKPSVVEDGVGIPKERTPSRRFSRAGSRREGIVPPVMNRSNSKTLLIDRKSNGSVRLYDGHFEKSRVKPDDGCGSFGGIGSVPKVRESEQVAAGWPPWLVSAAGEAIAGWIPRRADSFERLNKIGEGTYSSVYKARDLIHDKIVALKRVRFDHVDQESVKFMAREILILRRLDHPNIIKLEGLITSSTSTSLYLVFEYMKHDLTGLASLPGLQFTEPQVKCFMHQLLSGLEHCHSHGVLHRDIKGANLLIDDCGILKIADFGLATFFNPQKSLPLTSRVVTLWYRPPELLFGATHYGVSVDLWSAGCILGELFAGNPIMPGRTEVEQLHKIFKLCGSPPEEYWENMDFAPSTAFKPQRPYRRQLDERFHDVSSPGFALIDTLLSLDPASRGTASSALKSDFFTTKPLACDPSTLPKYPPSKEIDARKREEEAKRKQAVEDKQNRVDKGRQGEPDSAAFLSAKVNAEFVSSLLKKKSQYPKPHIEWTSSRRPDPTSGSSMLVSTRDKQDAKDVRKEYYDRQRGVFSGPLTRGPDPSHTGRKLNDLPSFSRLPNNTTRSNLAPNRTLVSEDSSRGHSFSQNNKATDPSGRFLLGVGDLVRKRNDDWLNYPGSHQLEEKTRVIRPALHNHAPDKYDDKIHFSGPLLQPSKDVDQMLKEHDLRIQEAARRARVEKFKQSKLLSR